MKEEGLQSESIAKVASALAKAQATLSTVGKDRAVTVTHKGGGSHSYSYATLAAVWEAMREALPGNGLAVVQTFKNWTAGGCILRTTLVHESGEWIASELPFGLVDDPQIVGSRITYFRRYALSALVGITSADEDDDGAKGGQGASDEAPARTYTTNERVAGAPVFRFGRAKGKPFSEGTASDLKWYADALRESIADPEKASYKASNMRDLATVEAVIEAKKATGMPEGGDVLVGMWRGRLTEAAKKSRAALDAELKDALDTISDKAIRDAIEADYAKLAAKFAAKAKKAEPHPADALTDDLIPVKG